MEAKYFPYIYPQQEVLRRMVARVKSGQAAEPGTIVNIIGMCGKYASDIHIAGGAANAWSVEPIITQVPLPYRPSPPALSRIVPHDPFA